MKQAPRGVRRLREERRPALGSVDAAWLTAWYATMRTHGHDGSHGGK